MDRGTWWVTVLEVAKSQDMTEQLTLSHFTNIWGSFQRRQWQPTPVLLPGEFHGGGAWWAEVHGVAKSRTQLSDFTFTFHFNALEKEMATHSSVLAWRIPRMGEPDGLRSMGSHRVGHDWSDLAAAAAAAEDHLFKRNGWIPEQIEKCVMFYLVLLQSPFTHFYWALKTISFSNTIAMKARNLTATRWQNGFESPQKL